MGWFSKGVVQASQVSDFLQAFARKE